MSWGQARRPLRGRPGSACLIERNRTSLIVISSTPGAGEGALTSTEAKEYRRRAEDCERLARLMPTLAQRQMMLAVAREWRALAGDSPVDPAGGAAGEPGPDDDR